MNLRRVAQPSVETDRTISISSGSWSQISSSAWNAALANGVPLTRSLTGWRREIAGHNRQVRPPQLRPFLSITDADTVPGQNTIREFREKLTGAGLFDEFFQVHAAYLTERGFITRKGSIVAGGEARRGALTVTMFVLDTCLVSEFTRKTPDPGVIAWLDQQVPSDLLITTLTLGEIAKGIERRPMSRKRTEIGNLTRSRSVSEVCRPHREFR